MFVRVPILFCFFFNDTATTKIYTLSLHDALPISIPVRGHGDRPVGRACGSRGGGAHRARGRRDPDRRQRGDAVHPQDRKSTRLNSSHVEISYAVFCLKKKRRNGTNERHARRSTSL